MMSPARTVLAALCAALALAAPTSADPSQVTLTATGDLLRVRAGNYGEIFGFGGFNNPVLVLEVVGPAKVSTQRLLVPGTDGEEVEASPSIVYEDYTSTTYLIWESRTNSIHSQIRLISYRDGQWSEPIDLPGEFFSLKTRPRLAITRDTYLTLDADGKTVARKRAIYHVVWWEEAGAGERVVYSPLVLLDGDYVGSSPLFVLSDLGFGERAAEAGDPTAELGRSPAIDRGRDRRRVVAGLTDAGSGKLVEVEIAVVPGELGVVSHQVSNVLAGGADLYPDAVPTLADRARAYLIEFGNRMRLHPGVVDSLAQALVTEILTGGPASEGEALGALADRARAYLIEFGHRMAAQGVTQEADAGTSWLLEFPAGVGEGTRPVHSLYVRLASSRPLPETKPGVPTTLYLSRDGEEALVVWEVGDRLDYRESKGDGWGPVRRLQLSDDLDLEEAHALLAERAQNR